MDVDESDPNAAGHTRRLPFIRKFGDRTLVSHEFVINFIASMSSDVSVRRDHQCDKGLAVGEAAR